MPGLGLHPGSGSQRPIIRDNRVERNQIGIFFCWGVRFGLAENNTIADAAAAGISIGHRDTDNLIRDNSIRGQREGRASCSATRRPAFAPHRNRCERNRIIDSGPEDGVGIDVQGQTEAVCLDSERGARNPPAAVPNRHPDRAQARDITLVDNRIEGYAVNISDADALTPQAQRSCAAYRFGLGRDSLALEDDDFGKDAVARLELLGTRAIHPAVAYREYVAVELVDRR